MLLVLVVGIVMLLPFEEFLLDFVHPLLVALVELVEVINSLHHHRLDAELRALISMWFTLCFWF